MSKILLAVLFAGFGAQFLKLVLYLAKEKSLKLHDLVVTGGTPSSHSAFVVALATAVYLEEGPSTAFVIALVLALIVLRDAFGVRRTVGEEGLLLTEILRKLKFKTNTHIALGHTPAQVLVGSLIGFVVAMVVYLV